MKIEAPLAVPILIEPYKQTLFFIIDDDMERVEAWLSQQIKEEITLSKYTKQVALSGCAFGLENKAKGQLRFVVLLKSWQDDERSIGRLAHECLHCTIQLLDIIGYRPKLKPKYSEPIAYQFEAIFRDCLIAVEMWKQRAHVEARRTRKAKAARRVSGRKKVRTVQRAVLANGTVGHGRKSKRHSSRRR